MLLGGHGAWRAVDVNHVPSGEQRALDSRYSVGAVGRTETDPQGELAREQGAINLLCVAAGNLQRGARLTPTKQPHCCGHHPDAESGQAHHAQVRVESLVQDVHRAARAIEDLVDFLHLAKECFALVGRLQPAARTAKNCKPELLLRVLQDLACRGLGDAQQRGCTADAPGLPDGMKDLDVGQAHRLARRGALVLECIACTLIRNRASRYLE